MTDNSARFRPVAFILGVSFIALPFFPVDDDVDLFTLGFGVTLGAIFIAHGIGGPSLLKKIGLASFDSKGARKESDSKHKIKSGLSFLTVGIGLGIFSLYFPPGGGAVLFAVHPLHRWADYACPGTFHTFARGWS